MKPHRMRMTHALIAAYGMFNHMAVQVSFGHVLVVTCANFA